MISRRAARELAARKLDRLLERRNPRAEPQDPADLLFLHDTIYRRQPARCIEFGSGQTTVFIAEALYRRNRGHLWSLDASADWLAHSRQMLPERLQPFVTFVHSPVELTDEHGVVAWRYQAVPQGPWDFVLIDGPEGTEESTFSSDLIYLIDDMTPSSRGMIDHRWRTAVLAKEVLGRRLRIRYMMSLESFLFRPRR